MSVKSTLKASTGLIFSVVLWGTLLAVAACVIGGVDLFGGRGHLWAAGAGAVLTLFDDDYVSRSKALAQTTRVVDLAAHPGFQSTFIQSLSF